MLTDKWLTKLTFCINLPTYAEMLKIEGELQSKVTSNLVNAAVVRAIQVDGSLSRIMRDNKFVSARIIDKDLNMKTVICL